MINVTDATKSAYTGDSIPKTLTISVPSRNITFTNADIVSQSLELTEAIENERSLTFKGCIASQFKFSVADIVTDLRGEYVEVTIQAGNTQVLPLFKGYVDEQNNLTYEDVVTEFTCYDILYQKGEIECIDWYESLTFPISVKRFRDSFFAFIGIDQEDNALVNDSLQMVKTVSSDNSLKSRYVMQCICQANARFGRIGRNGKFQYVKLEGATSSFGTYPGANTFPGEETYPAKPINTQILSNSMYKTVDYNPYPTDRITKVVVWDEAEIVKGESGEGTNIFKVAGNMVAYSVDLNVCATNIFNEVKDIACTSTRISLIGLPYVECGDMYKYATRKNMINDYVLSRTLKGIQALNDDFSSNLDQYQSDDNSLSNQIQRLNGKTNVLTRTVDETRSELTEYERTTDNTLREQSSVISQTAETVSSTVTRVDTIDGTVQQQQSAIEQNATAITLKVSKGTVSSEISQEAGKITISSNRLIVNSTNFKLSEDGTIQATNGQFSGKITASSGTIGGFTITSSSIYKGKSSFTSTTEGLYIGTDGINIGGQSHGFKVSSYGDITMNAWGSSPIKIGISTTIDQNGYISVGSTKITASEISLGATQIFKVYNVGYTLKVGSVMIDCYSTSRYMKVPTNFELRDSSSYGYTKIKFGSSLEVGYAGALKLGNSSSNMGFFGGTGSTKKSVNKLSTSATLANVITKVNDLLTALNGYGLISSS